MKRRNYLMFLASVALVFGMMTSCGGGGGGSAEITQEDSTLFENAGIVDTSGGTIQAVGAYINIPPNGLEGETHIVFESESPSSDWGETDVNAYKLISDAKILSAEIVVDNTFQSIEKDEDLEV